MKKIFALLFLLAFSLPSFTLTLKIGDTFDYVPNKDGKEKVSIVTKIAENSTGKYELTLLSDNVSYTYIVSAGEQIHLYTKSPTKSKEMIAKTITITSVRNNTIEFDTISGKAASSANIDAK